MTQHKSYREAFKFKYGVESDVWPSHLENIIKQFPGAEPDDERILKEMLDWDPNAKSQIRQWEEQAKWAGPLDLNKGDE